MYKIIELYKALGTGETLLPTNTNFDFWEDVYEESPAVYDREFARKFSHFLYYDFLQADNVSDARSDLHSDIVSILTMNQKKYAEMYRVFCVEDEDDPITYNYDMTETTGKQKTTDTFGGTSFTKGQQLNTKGSMDMTYGATSFTEGEQIDTKGQRQDTIGSVTTSHNVAPFNSTIVQAESNDIKGDQQNTEGSQQNTKGARTDTTLQHVDTEGQRQDTEGSRTDTTLQHVDTHENDEWTLTRKGNIGVQTAGDILRIHTEFWTEHFKFMNMIFDDIAKELLLIGE